jgi:hypothetical protein
LNVVPSLAQELCQQGRRHVVIEVEPHVAFSFAHSSGDRRLGSPRYL